MGLMVCDLGVHFGNELRMYDLLEIIGELSSVLVFYVTDAVKYFFFLQIGNLSLTLNYLNNNNIANSETDTQDIIIVLLSHGKDFDVYIYIQWRHEEVITQYAFIQK